MVLYLLSVLPKKWLSRFVGFWIYLERPRFFSRLLKGILIKSLKIDPREAEYPVSSYASFGLFFTRKLKPESRKVDQNEFISPCDGNLTECGDVVEGQLIQCKGKRYPLETLLLNPDLVEIYAKAFYMTIYLAPHNYHRVHCPVESKLSSSLYIPGTLWPVNSNSVTKIENLFCKNERWVGHFESDFGEFALIMVGATNVGKIEIKKIQGMTNTHSAPKDKMCYYSPEITYQKGEEYGIFHMGSTVICLLSEEMRKKMKLVREAGEIRFGEGLFERLDSTAE